MASKDIFTKLATHQLEGVMFHESMVDAFLYLGLDGYRAAQIKHVCEELSSFLCTKRYYRLYYNALLDIPQQEYKNDVVSEDWHKSDDISINKADFGSSVRELYAKWLNWEKDTKNFYEGLYSEAIAEHDIAAANYISCLIKDVSNEILSIRKIIMKLSSMDYDSVFIHDCQNDIYKFMNGKEYDKYL